jgi:hypothetical protein
MGLDLRAAPLGLTIPRAGERDERQRSVLDAPLGPGLAVAAAGSVAGTGWTRGGERCLSPIGAIGGAIPVPTGGVPRNKKPPAGWVYRLGALVYRASHREGMT